MTSFFIFVFLLFLHKRQLRELDFRLGGNFIFKRIAVVPKVDNSLIVEKLDDDYKNRHKEDSDKSEQL